MREWLYASLLMHSFVTITVPAEHCDEGAETVTPFEILTTGRMRQATLFDVVEEERQLLWGCRGAALRKWSAVPNDRTGLPDTLNTFTLENPA